MELTKQIVRVGNSAGVILPREWLNGTAIVKLIEKPLNIKEDILGMLDEYLHDIIGIYIVGSYARNEETEKSDVDVLAITNKTNKKITKGKYSIILISRAELEDAVEKLALPIIPMIIEAKTIINDSLIEECRKKARITKKNTRPIIELIESALKINKEFIKIAKASNEYLGDAVSYSLILNLRSLYLLDCLRKDKKWSSAELKKIIRKVSGSLNAYEGYIRAKNNQKTRETLPAEEAEKLYFYLNKECDMWKKWLKGKKD